MFLVFKFNGFFLLRDKRGKNSKLFTIFNNRDLNYGSRLFYIGSMISLFETQMRINTGARSIVISKFFQFQRISNKQGKEILVPRIRPNLKKKKNTKFNRERI